MHKFIVYPGNHPEVIRDVIIKRGNYQEITATDSTSDAEFIWRPCNFSSSHLSKLNPTRPPNTITTHRKISAILRNIATDNWIFHFLIWPHDCVCMRITSA